MIRKNLLISYALDFVSYLLTERYIEKYEIKNIILYGSIPRGDYTEKSDIDIFIDIIKADKSLEQKLKQTIKDFYESIWFKKWKRMNIKNEINCLVGNLEEWKDLQRSIISNSIILYGSYKPKIKGNIMSLFTIENIKPESKRVFINRKLFGYKRYGKKYEGLLEKYNYEKIAKGCFIVPVEYHKKVLQFLRKEKISVKIREINLI